MRQQLLLITGAIAIAMAGCASEETATTPSPTPASPAPAASPTASPAAGQPFAKPLVAQKPAATATVPGLIQPTNPDERAKQVQANINAAKAKRDPFASIPVTIQGTGTQPQTQALAPQAPRVPKLPNPPRPGTARGDLTAIAPSGSPPRPSSPFPPNRSQTRTPQAPVQPAAPPPPPPPPQPVLAPATEVSGIVYVSGEPQAIVKAPNERTSRYVRVGQRLSDGQILVKRIELNTGAEPLVILEENGVEVPKIVGEKSAPPPGAPAA